MAIFAAIVAISTGAWAQDDPEAALRKAKEAREKCERLLAGVEDATVLGHGGGGTVYRIMISCGDEKARDEAKKRFGGDAVDGIAILWSFRKAAAPPAEKADPKDVPIAPPAPKEREKKLSPWESDPENPWKASATDCDIIRDYL